MSSCNMNTVEYCQCKSSCSTKRRENGSRGCPCKGRNILCSSSCRCGTRNKLCTNKERGENSQPTARTTTSQRKRKSVGFRLSHPLVDSEETQREKEHKDVKDFIATLDEAMVRKLAVRGLRRGIGSMDYIHTLLIMEDDLDETEHDEEMGAFEEDSRELHSSDQQFYSDQLLLNQDQPHSSSSQPEPHNPLPTSVPDWCICGCCRPMPQEIENKCCRQNNCITLTSRFAKICLDPDVLELCIRNTGDIRNDQEDNSTQAFRKAGYRQFVLARHGHLGKGNRRVCPSCVVLKIRARYPSVTGVYMGFMEH